MGRLLGWLLDRREARRERKLGALLEYARQREADLDAELEAHEFPREVEDQMLVIRCPRCAGEVHEFEAPNTARSGQFISWLELDPEPGRVYGGVCGDCGFSFKVLHRETHPVPRVG